ncbi:hypothetical protein BGZ83_002741 [Gryganskiella cystojenkinii]|nr:hypothetical protein BGZ83_002741 [Gryganskiella cystojenkinii]
MSCTTLSCLPTYHSISEDDEGNSDNIQLIYKVKPRYLQDPLIGVHQTFILWSDVRILIKDAEYALDGDGSLIPFIVNDDCEELVPRRIMCHPDKVLEVVVSTAAHIETNNTQLWDSLQQVFFAFALSLFFIALAVGFRIAFR